MPKYYSPNLVQIPTCHGSLAYDYDNERRRREVGAVGAQLPCWLRKPRLRGDRRPRWRSAQARILQELPVKYHSKITQSIYLTVTQDASTTWAALCRKKSQLIGCSAFENLKHLFVCRVTPQAEEKRRDSGIRQLITWVTTVGLIADIHRLQRMNHDYVVALFLNRIKVKEWSQDRQLSNLPPS